MRYIENSCILFAVIINACLAKLPNDVQLCKAGDNDCITKVTNSMIHANPNGRPDLGIPKIDPLHIIKIIINEGSNGPLNLDLSIHDMDIKGLSKIKVDRQTGFIKDIKNTQFELYGTIPKLELNGKYKTNGRILILPVQGEGNADITLDNVKISIKIKPTVIERDGHINAKTEKIKLLLEPSKMTVHLTNLFNGDKVLGDNMNLFLNENWKDVWNELSPGINSAYAEVVRSLMDPFFQKYHYDELFLPD